MTAERVGTPVRAPRSWPRGRVTDRQSLPQNGLLTRPTAGDAQAAPRLPPGGPYTGAGPAMSSSEPPYVPVSYKHVHGDVVRAGGDLRNELLLEG